MSKNPDNCLFYLMSKANVKFNVASQRGDAVKTVEINSQKINNANIITRPKGSLLMIKI